MSNPAHGGPGSPRTSHSSVESAKACHRSGPAETPSTWLRLDDGVRNLASSFRCPDAALFDVTYMWHRTELWAKRPEVYTTKTEMLE